MLLELSRPEDALPAYRRAADLDGRSAAAWAGQAKALAAAGRDREASKARDAAEEMRAHRKRRRTEGEAGGQHGHVFHRKNGVGRAARWPLAACGNEFCGMP